MKHWMIQIEGIDKTGKDLLVEYIKKYSNFSYTPYSRGIVSLLVYTDKYNRDYSYDLESIITKNWVFVYLDYDEDDMKIRHSITNHNYEEYKNDKQLFEKYLKQIEKIGCKILRYNVSKMTYIDITKDIIKNLEEMER